MSEPATHPFTLRFLDDELETQFIHDYVEKSRKPIQMGLLVGLAVYGLLFGVVDLIQSSNAMTQILVIRGLVCLIGISVLLYFRAGNVATWLHEGVAVVILVAGIGLLAMILLDNSPDAYLDGPVLLILPAYVLFRLRFVQATIVGMTIFALYCCVIYFLEGMRASELFASAIFLLAANLIGMAAGYALESYARKEFWQTRIIDQERAAKERLLEAKNRFFANISHEIRTPLTLMLGPTEDLLREESDSLSSRVLSVLKATRRNGERLLKFMNQLLDLSKVDDEEVALLLQRGELVGFLTQEIEHYRSYAASQNITLTLHCEQDVIIFTTDYDKLDVIVSNLVSNAIKYTTHGGKVEVHASQSAEGIEIRVKDNGPGIPADQLDNLFDRFYRVEAAHVAKTDGLGLGLSLTHALVERLGGSISVESKVSVGSVFTVLLPEHHVEDVPQLKEAVMNSVSREPAADVIISSANSDGVVHSSGQSTDQEIEIPSLLVVEDNDEMRRYICACLSEYVIYEAGNGSEAVKVIETEMPDLVVSDLMMPDMDGYGLITSIRAHDMLSHIPFIMLTAAASEDAKLQSLEKGVDDYLTKPFNRRELQLRVRNMLSARRRNQLANQGHVLMEPALEEIESSERVFLEKLRTLIDERLADEKFNGDAVADELGVSVRHLQRKTKALLGETPTALIRMMRLKKGKQLLDASYGTVSEVAYAVGFNNPTYFTKCFREYFGEAPTRLEK